MATTRFAPRTWIVALIMITTVALPCAASAQSQVEPGFTLFGPYLGQAGLSLISGLVGSGSTSDIVGTVGGFGLNTLFLKFSREDEEEADIVGARILSDAGYDPMVLVAVFDSLQAATDGSGGGDISTFLSSHPPYEDRRETVRREARRIGEVDMGRPIGGFDAVQAELASMSEARPMEVLRLDDLPGRPGVLLHLRSGQLDDPGSRAGLRRHLRASRRHGPAGRRPLGDHLRGDRRSLRPSRHP